MMTSKIDPHILRSGNRHILYDGGLIAKPSDSLFDPGQLAANGQLMGQALGRGEAYFFRLEGKEMVLRHYRRGGFMAKFLKDQYVGLNPEATRAWREWRLLVNLYEKGLPVPRPVAASVCINLGVYRADLITERIPATHTLADRLKKAPLSGDIWQKIGLCIKRFHNEDVYHADLNANNILLDKEEMVFLIDFDRGCFRAPGPWKNANLLRLERSLKKIAAQSPVFHFNEVGWQGLIKGYEESAA